MDQSTVLIWFRVAERGVLLALFTTFVVSLFWLYRNDLVARNVVLQASSVRVAAVVTLPILVAVLLLGYIYVSLSNPISIDCRPSEPVPPATAPAAVAPGPAGPVTAAPGPPAAGSLIVRLFDEQGMSQSFTRLARRTGSFDYAQLSRVQDVLRVAIQIENAKMIGKGGPAEAILADETLSIGDVGRRLDALIRG